MEIAAGGELYDYLSERKCLEEVEAKRIFRQIATAVYYCHKNNICHRDLKLENILLDENGNAKVSTLNFKTSSLLKRFIVGNNVLKLTKFLWIMTWKSTFNCFDRCPIELDFPSNKNALEI